MFLFHSLHSKDGDISKDIRDIGRELGLKTVHWQAAIK